MNMKRLFWTSRIFVLVLSMGTILLALPSCRSLDTAMPSSAASMVSATIHTRDTIVLRDSIYIREFVKGDTVYRDRIAYRDRWRTQIIHDTITRTDSIVQVIEHPPERYVPPFYKRCTMIFWILIAAIILYIILKIRSPVI